MVSWEEAVARIVGELSPVASERVPLEAALGRALAEDVVAPADVPRWANSAMDGWAIRSADAPGPDAVLPIAGERFAGSVPGDPLPAGAAVRIFTGAPVPLGADCVVKQEDATPEGDRVRFRSAARAGDNVRPAAEDARAGEVALARGIALGPPELGHAAAMGRSHVLVTLRPRIGLLATGDELLGPGEPAREGAFPESNTVALAAALLEAGGEPVRLGIARDRPGEVEARLSAAASCDGFVTCGGASVGERDLVKEALAKLRARQLFWQVAIRPGKPFGLWQLPGGRPVFVLPGNPASALVTFELFVRPGVRRLAGQSGHGRHEVWARLAAAARKPKDLALFVRGNLVDGAFRASAHQSSGLTRSLVGQRALAILPVGPDRLDAGAEVTCRLL